MKVNILMVIDEGTTRKESKETQTLELMVLTLRQLGGS